MAIEINGVTHNPLPATTDTGGVDAARRDNVPAQPQSERSSASDTVSLTDTAQNLRGIQQSLQNVPVVDTQRVEAIKQAIANGSYEVDPVRVAEKLMNLEHALSGAR